MENISRNLIASTYDDDEILTSLYLENRLLREMALGEVAATTISPVAANVVREQGEYWAVSHYLDRTAQKEVCGSPRILVVANEYPNVGSEYGNGFIHRRVVEYIKEGYAVDVVAFNKRKDLDVYVFDGVAVLQGYVRELNGLLSIRQYSAILTHFLNHEMWNVITPHIKAKKTPWFVFIHGYEADRWIRRSYACRTSDELRASVRRTLYLQQFWGHVTQEHSAVTKFIFVSDYWRRVVAEDMDVVFPRDKIETIHNFVDESLFWFKPKPVEQRFKLLWVRSAASLKYGPDLAVEVIRSLLSSSYGSQVSATVIGDGDFFHLFEDAFSGDSRVDVQRRFAQQEEIAELHRKHGLFVVPTRLDSQGVSRDEAMASGLIPLTNAVTAIPEFVDDTCAVLDPGFGSAGMVAGALRIMEDPNLFLRMSSAARRRVVEISGRSATVMREIKLMREAIS